MSKIKAIEVPAEQNSFKNNENFFHYSFVFCVLRNRKYAWYPFMSFFPQVK